MMLYMLFEPGLGFVTSIIFILFIGIFASSWLGATVFLVGEWFIKRMPFVKHLYSASKQISSAISPGNSFFSFVCAISTTLKMSLFKVAIMRKATIS